MSWLRFLKVSQMAKEIDSENQIGAMITAHCAYPKHVIHKIV